MEIRFAVIPPATVNKQAGILGKKFGNKFPSRFLVDNKKLFPHITLFKVNVPQKNYKALLLIAKNELKKFASFSIDVNGYFFHEGGWLGLKIAPNKKLIDLRKKLFKQIKASGLSNARMKVAYKPHITLTRFYSDKSAKASVTQTPTPKFKMKVENIGLCLSRQTQVYKIVNSIKLS